VRVLGLDPWAEHTELVGRIGVMLQTGGVYTGIRPPEVLRLFAGYYDDPADPDELLERVGLADRKRSTWRSMSGGEQQRLSLALALIGRPEVAFLDEPTAGIDPAGRQLIRRIVADLRADGVAVLLTTHDLDEAEKLADRVLVLAAGRIVADDTVDGLAQRLEGESLVRWTASGQRRSESVADATAFVRRLFDELGDDVGDLEVRRASLEDAYLALVQQHEAGHGEAAARLFAQVAR
jgi:ABC-2 type transport system ATP-binding protein